MMKRIQHGLLLALMFCVFSSRLHGSEPISSDEVKPHAVIVIGTHHYSPQLSLPLFAEELQHHGFRVTVVAGKGDPEKKQQDVLPGIEKLDEADVAILFLRFLKLPDAEWRYIEKYIQSGKPIVGLRTSNHAFRYPAGHPREKWNDDFGRRVLGTPYVVHQASRSQIEVVGKYAGHPILQGVDAANWTSSAKLYLTRLEPGCVPLLTGTGTGRARLVERSYGVLQVNQSERDIVAWTWSNHWGARVFATSLGHLDDFADERFTRLLINGICWATESPLPAEQQPIATWKIERGSKK